MAEAEADSPIDGGYDADFVQPLDKDLECPVCLLALREPMQTSCGHLMCRVCINKITRHRQFRCPIDNTCCLKSKVFPDAYNERRVLNLTVRCANHSIGCPWTGELRKLETHRCSLSSCVFKSVGCTHMGSIEDEGEHEETHMKSHIRLLLDAVTTQNENLTEQVVKLTRQVQSLESTVATLQRHETTNREGGNFTCRWTIDNWPEVLQAAKNESDNLRSHRILSRPYYVSHPGHKVCLEAFPCGTQAGQGGYLSIYMKVMKGQYDDNLDWPFRFMYSVSVVDQKAGGMNKTRSIDPPVEPDGTPFVRPQTDKNPGRGWAQFISHSDLLTRQYIKDGNLVIQLDVYLT